jgi:hypothetical protein
MSFSASAVIEVGIGIIVVYYVLGLITSGITTWITSITQLRAKDLEENLREVLADSGKFDAIMQHPWVQNLKPKKVNLFGKLRELEVAKIPTQTFARVLFDVLAPGEDGKGTLEDVRNAINGLPAGKAKSHLTGLVNAGVAKLEDARSGVETWFDEVMMNISSVYGQHARQIVMVVSLALTLFLNVDTVKIVTNLWEAPTKRAIAAAQADEILAAQPESVDITDIPELVGVLESIEIPLFWTPEDVPATPKDAAIKLSGLIITWVATAQGSPFWYDVLRRLRTGQTAGEGAK